MQKRALLKAPKHSKERAHVSTDDPHAWPIKRASINKRTERCRLKVPLKVALFRDAGCLTGETAQIVELGTADFTAADHCNAI